MRVESSVASESARWRVGFVLAFTLLQSVKLGLAMRLAPFVDEAFYWQESRHLAWGYSDLPPLTAWLIRLGETVTGQHGVLAMRWPFLLLGAALPWLVVVYARSLFGARAGWQAGLWCLALPLAGTLGLLALPDVPLTFAFMLAVLGLSAAMARDRWRDWLLLGLALALAWMTHYRAGMLVLAGAVLLVATPRGRTLWRRPGLWLAFGMMLAGMLPMLASNLSMHGAGLEFQLVQRNPWRFHADALVQPLEQALVCTPLLYGLLLWAAWRSMLRAREGAAGDWDLVAVLAWTFLGGYFLFGLFADDTHFRVHWPLPGYLPLLAVLPVLIREHRPASPAWKGLVIATAALAALFQVAIVAWLGMTTVPGAANWLHRSKAYPAQFIGWRESGNRVRSLLRQSAPGTVLVADNFEMAAELDFQLDGSRPVYVLDSPLNVKHGRRAQLHVWRLDGASLRRLHAGAPMLLVVEESRLAEREQPLVLGASCRRIIDPKRVGDLAFGLGRKRVAFYEGTVPRKLLPQHDRDACPIWMHAYHTRQAAELGRVRAPVRHSREAGATGP